jgi:predicted nucleotidyltransferase
MELVEDLLHSVETEFDITILFAVEAGSRATGLHSHVSDFDVRFVFYHNSKAKYLSLCDPAECLSGFSHDRIIDWQGWDVRKSLKLIRQTNPTAVEWVYSPIVYICRRDVVDFAAECRHIVEIQRHRVPLVFHYAAMARKVFVSEIDGQLRVSTKKYLAVVRGVLMIEWQFFESSKGDDHCASVLLDLDFRSVLTAVSKAIPQPCVSWIVHAAELKRQVVEEMDRVPVLDEWIRSCLDPAELKKRIKLFLGEQRSLSVDLFDAVFMKVFELCT